MTETPFRTAKQSHTKSPDVRALARGLRVLEIMTDAPRGLPLSRLAEESGLSKSSAHRLAQTLVHEGYLLQKQDNGHYLPSLKVLRLGHKLIEDTDLTAVSRPHLQLLAQETGETAHLVLLDRDTIVYVDKVESPNPIRMYSRIGLRAPAHCTGAGKAILAFLSPERLQAVLGDRPLQRHTKSTITDRRELRRHLAKVRKRRYAIDDGEHEEQVRCLATPLFASNGEPAGAISLAAVSYRVDLETLRGWWPLLRERSQALSADLSHYFDRYI
ncbi:MAG: IclR family transcriptional regulator [Anaerolineae bacterium]|nr:MAG: IclR family transcriptional regulator [Anaerolineae bacterium]